MDCFHFGLRQTFFGKDVLQGKPGAWKAIEKEEVIEKLKRYKLDDLTWMLDELYNSLWLDVTSSLSRIGWQKFASS